MFYGYQFFSVVFHKITVIGRNYVYNVDHKCYINISIVQINVQLNLIFLTYCLKLATWMSTRRLLCILLIIYRVRYKYFLLFRKCLKMLVISTKYKEDIQLFAATYHLYDRSYDYFLKYHHRISLLNRDDNYNSYKFY